MTNKERLAHWVRLRGMHTVLRTLSSVAQDAADNVSLEGKNGHRYAVAMKAKGHWEGVARALDRMSVDVEREQSRIGEGHEL